jgi:hypothetical protein
LLLLPLAPVPQLLIPAFVLVAARPVFLYISGLLNDPAPSIRAAISGRLALLGNRVGDEIASEFGSHLADLHRWQYEALSQCATQVAERAVSLV